MSYVFLSDPHRAILDFRNSVYFTELCHDRPFSEVRVKYRLSPLDTSEEQMSDVLKGEFILRQLSTHLRDIPRDVLRSLTVRFQHVLSLFRDRFHCVFHDSLVNMIPVNVVRLVEDDVVVEYGASWTCGDTIFLTEMDSFEHECCHILQRRYPHIFHSLYTTLFHITPIPWSSGRLIRYRLRDQTLLNPDTLDACSGLEYGLSCSFLLTDPRFQHVFDKKNVSSQVFMYPMYSTSREMIYAIIDPQSLWSECVDLNNDDAPTITVFGDVTVTVDHPHEMMADIIERLLPHL